jgi:RNA polymerase sigma-70 factor, ECF subfamily
MPVTANAKFRNLGVASLSRPTPTPEKRCSFRRDTRPSTECNVPKAAPSTATGASDELNEAEAIRRAQAGDPAVYEYLYRLHSRRVYALCLRMVKDKAEAEDLTQEAFLLLFRKIHTFRGESAFSTWLHRLAVNLVLMRLRKKSLPVFSIEAIPDADDETAPLRSLELGAADLSLEGAIDRINLHRCIQRLPAGFRKVFVLHDIQGYRHREIASLLGRSVGDSKSQLHKARKRLRESLRELQRNKTRDERLMAANCLPDPPPLDFIQNGIGAEDQSLTERSRCNTSPRKA